MNIRHSRLSRFESVAIFAVGISAVIGISSLDSPHCRATSLMRRAPTKQSQTQTGARSKIGPEVADELDQLIRSEHVNPFWLAIEEEYEAVLQAAKVRLAEESLSREQRIVELLKILAVIGDGHSGVSRNSQLRNLGYMPVTFEWFGDELRVVETAAEFEFALGARLVAIEGTDIEGVKRLLAPVIPLSNWQRFLKRSPLYLQMPGVLFGLGITGSPDRAECTLELRDGERRTVTFQRLTGLQFRQTEFVTFDKQADTLPLYRQRQSEPYWFEYLADEQIFYLKYNVITSDDANPINTWAAQMWSHVDDLVVDKIVIDLRGNGGGGFEFAMPIIQGLLNRPQFNARGKLFVLSDEKVFSAAITLLATLEERTKAIIVGTPPSAGPAHPGDNEQFLLGTTGIQINLSQIYHESVFAGDRRRLFGLDARLENSWSDYVAGRDVQLEYVKSYQPAATSSAGQAAFQWIGRYDYKPDEVLTIGQANGDLVLSIGRFVSTPLYPLTENRFATEIVGLKVGFSDDNQIELDFAGGERQSYRRRTNAELTPGELLVGGRFDEARAAYLELLRDEPDVLIKTDAQFADTALLLYWSVIEANGEAEARKYARKTLELAIDVLPEAPISQYKLGLYR